jgi:hypothetical protein
MEYRLVAELNLELNWITFKAKLQVCFFRIAEMIQKLDRLHIYVALLLSYRPINGGAGRICTYDPRLTMRFNAVGSLKLRNSTG